MQRQALDEVITSSRVQWRVRPAHAPTGQQAWVNEPWEQSADLLERPYADSSRPHLEPSPLVSSPSGSLNREPSDSR